MNHELKYLYQFIVKHYNLQELRTLCFKLGIRYSDLGGEGIAAKSRELLLQTGRRMRFEQLLVELWETRPRPFRQAGLSRSPDLVKKLQEGMPSLENPSRFSFSARWSWTISFSIIATLIVIVFGFQDSGNTITVHGDQFNGDITFNEVSLVVEQIQQSSGVVLTDSEVEQLEQAMKFIQSRKFDQAISLLESVEVAIPVPSLLNNLGGAYLAIGDQERAKIYFEQALDQNPDDKAAQINLDRLVAAQLLPTPTRPLQTSNELEPNNDFLSVNLISLNSSVQGNIANESDTDYFKFTMLSTYRDRVQIELENRSMTLEPEICVYNSRKSNIVCAYDPNDGADLIFWFPAEPDEDYYIQIQDDCCEGVENAEYVLNVKTLGEYDLFEPNDDFDQARPIFLGEPIEANILDRDDTDFYKLTSQPQSGTFTVSIENHSMQLELELYIYGSDGPRIVSVTNSDLGTDLSYSFNVDPSSEYYLEIVNDDCCGHPWWFGNGEYTLLVTQE